MKFKKGVSSQLNPNYKPKKSITPNITFIKSKRPKLNRDQTFLRKI
jgi:hypothetical protein